MVFLIIFGTRGVTYTSTRGQFQCPTCHEKRAYEKRRVRRFFTLYFLPVIPLDKVGEYIECQTCKNTFKPDVLTFEQASTVDGGSKPEPPQAEFHAALPPVKSAQVTIRGNRELLKGLHKARPKRSDTTAAAASGHPGDAPRTPSAT